ncbi:MAG: hypothetical protein ACRDSJ_17195 [Rubrobacteraceae bacterium]
MARAGDIIENPVTGERITFVKTARDAGGELLRFEYLAPAHTAGPPLHVHPYQEERFVEILSGKLRARLGKDERRGVPRNPLRAAATAREYGDELRLAWPPFAVQKALLGLLAPVCRLLGYGGRYPKHGDSESSPP